MAPKINAENIFSMILQEIRKYTLQEIAKHNKKEDCWLIYNGKVHCGALLLTHAKKSMRFMM